MDVCRNACLRRPLGTDETLIRWQEGRTGWPLVDANMRELKVAASVQGIVLL